MENLTKNRIFLASNIFQFNHLKQCVNFYSQSLRWHWSRLSSSVASLMSGTLESLRQAAKPRENDSKLIKLQRAILSRLLVHAGLAGAVTNVKAVVLAFARFSFGLLIILVLVPVVDFFYTRFDINDKVATPDVWYYESWYWLWLTLGPYMAGIVRMIGIYFCLVQKSTIKSYVLAFCVMYDFGKILWLLQVKNHDEYNLIVPSDFVVYGFLCGVFLVLMLNLLSFWLFHRLHAFWKRLQGIAQIADKAPSEIVVKSFVETMQYGDKVKQFNL
jgi:hypothetical protein